MQFLRETHQTNERVKVSRDFQLYFSKFQQAQRRDDGFQDTIIRRAEKNLDLSRTQRLPVHLAVESTAISRANVQLLNKCNRVSDHKHVW